MSTSEAPSGSMTLQGSLPWILALRFLRGRRSRLLDSTARSALAAIALGVAAMVIAMALMTGYREDLQNRLIEGNSALIAQPVAAVAPEIGSVLKTKLEEIPGVEAVGQVAYGRGVLSTGGTSGAGDEGGREGFEVTLRGVDAGGRQLAARAEDLRLGEDGIPGVVVGGELLRRLGAAEGDVLRLVALGFEADHPRFRYRSIRVRGSFDTGFAEFDGEWVVLDRSLLEEMVGERGSLQLYEFTLRDPDEAPAIAERAREVMGDAFLLTDWQELNQELFAALKVQQLALFLVLGLIVLVSTFNVASTLVILVRERMRDIGALGAMGLPASRLWGVFLLYGAILGTVGIGLGAAAGAAIAWTLDSWELIRFDSEVAAIYFIRSVQFRVDPVDLLAVVAFSLAVTLLACLVPAWRAATLEPSRALRYE